MLECKQDVAKGVGMESKVNIFKIGVVLWGRREETKVTQAYHKQGSGGGAPSHRGHGRFFENFL